MEWFIVVRNIIFSNITHFVIIHKKAKFTLKALNQFFADIFGQKLNKSLRSAPSVLMYKDKNV